MHGKPNNLVFFSFAMVPKDIYLENVWYKNRLNFMTLALCLAMGSDRIIVKQGIRLLGLLFDNANSLRLPFSPESLYFILRGS